MALAGAVLIVAGATVENNRAGVVAAGGSTVMLDGSVIQNNTGNGLTLNDTSVAGTSGMAAEIRNNAGWGVACSPAPGVSQIFQPLGNVTGNGAGQVSCPSTPPAPQ